MPIYFYEQAKYDPLLRVGSFCPAQQVNIQITPLIKMYVLSLNGFS